MLLHFVFNLSWSFHKGTLEDLFWISHLGTLIGGIGAILMNRLLVSVALICLFVHHGFWMADTFTWFITGSFPFGTTSYLKDAEFWTWLKTSNHFFTVPALLVISYFLKGISKYAWIWCGALFSVLTAASYFFLPPEANVNCAHGLWPGMENIFLGVLANLNSWLYLVSIILLNIFANHLPVYIVLRLVYRYILLNKK